MCGVNVLRFSEVRLALHHVVILYGPQIKRFIYNIQKPEEARIGKNNNVKQCEKKMPTR